jgi:ribosomal-protein-alanine N-acetyltransferase
MAGAVARFFTENWEGHLDRWSPPAAPGFFEPKYWHERLERAEVEWESGISARFVLQPPGPESGPVLGTCNYTNIVRGPFQACHLGYQIDRDHEGRGLMREALEALNAFAFDEMGLHRIMANYIPTNERSGQLLARLGFEREGYAKNYLYIADSARPRAHGAREPRIRPGPLRAGRRALVAPGGLGQQGFHRGLDVAPRMESGSARRAAGSAGRGPPASARPG